LAGGESQVIIAISFSAVTKQLSPVVNHQSLVANCHLFTVGASLQPPVSAFWAPVDYLPPGKPWEISAMASGQWRDRAAKVSYRKDFHGAGSQKSWFSRVFQVTLFS
jgi:hypothetical protein